MTDKGDTDDPNMFFEIEPDDMAGVAMEPPPQSAAPTQPKPPVQKKKALKKPPPAQPPPPKPQASQATPPAPAMDAMSMDSMDMNPQAGGEGSFEMGPMEGEIDINPQAAPAAPPPKPATGGIQKAKKNILNKSGAAAAPAKPPSKPAPPQPLDGGDELEIDMNPQELNKPAPKDGDDKPIIRSSAPPEPAPQDGEDGGGRFGDKLIARGIISEDQLNVALQEKKVSGKLLGEVLVDLGFLDEETLSVFLAEASGFDVFDPGHTVIDNEVLALIDKNTAMKHQVLPISVTEEEAMVVMADPYDVVAMDTLRKFLPKGLRVQPLVATATVLYETIENAYGYASSINDILAEIEEGGGANEEDIAMLTEEEAYSHPIVRLVNAIVAEAVKWGASDLHFEPEENFVRVRCRRDGVLVTTQTLHKNHWSAIAQRLKIMSDMNIADKLSPQDGRFNLVMGSKEADFRVSSLPTVHGENIVLRVLDQSASIMPMEKLGFSELNRDLIKKSLARPEGIIIVTGPTGSGKTTSLYSMLNEINDVQVNIQTLEDPVEYSLPMIRQTPVREGVLSFADGIKALLRQDPDIIFIGEIRDKTTAEMALKASMTGHQVFTSLHTNDSFGAIPRIFDLGLKPGMVAGAIISVFAQRLARRVCQDCKEAYKPNEKECKYLGVDPKDPPEIYRAKQGGCPSCEGLGYKGRVAVVEILMFDEDLDNLVAKGASKGELKELAVEKGFKSMADDGILKILEGVTTLEALSKVVNVDL